MAYGLPQLLQSSGILSLAVFDYPRCYRVRAQQRRLCGGGHPQRYSGGGQGTDGSCPLHRNDQGTGDETDRDSSGAENRAAFFGNEFVSLIKETSVLSYVGVVEILRKGALWNAATFNTFEAYIGVALVYMLLTIPSSKLVKHLEKKMANSNAE